MVVPYRDPSPDHHRRTAFDIGEWGLGFMTTSLELGCDCLGEITYVDAVLHDSKGEPTTITNAICLHEEDDGVLWKHVDEKAGAEVRRSRRMVVSFHATVANYEYLIYWRFYQDGTIECEVRATGIMVTSAFDGAPPPYGTVVDERTYAPFHQHFIVARMDLEVDGPENTVVVSESEALPVSEDNPYGLALVQRSRPLLTESEGRQDVDFASQRSWKVVNRNRLNRLGTPTALQARPVRRPPGAGRPGRAVPDSAPRSSTTRSGSRRTPRRSGGPPASSATRAGPTPGCPSGRRPTGRSPTPTSCCGTCSASTTSPGPRTGRSCRWTSCRSRSSRSGSSTATRRSTCRRRPRRATRTRRPATEPVTLAPSEQLWSATRADTPCGATATAHSAVQAPREAGPQASGSLSGSGGRRVPHA